MERKKNTLKGTPHLFSSKHSARTWGQFCEVVAIKIMLQTLLRGAEINLLMNYFTKRTAIAKDRSRWQNKAFQDSPGHSTCPGQLNGAGNGTCWDEPPWEGGGLEEGGSGVHEDPHASAAWWKEESFPGGCFCSSLISLHQQLCICHLQGEVFSKPAPLQRPVNEKRAAFKPNCGQSQGIHSDALKLLI